MAEVVTPTPAELEAARRWLASLGLEDLYAGWDKYIRDGYTDMEVILQMVSTDPTYKAAFDARFPAIEMIRKENVQRANAGLPLKYEPTAQDYVNLEVGYRQALRGLGPVGEAMARKDNFTKWITGEVNVDEIEQRLQIAEEYLYSDMNADVRQQLRDIYGLSDAEMIQYVVSDPKHRVELESEFSRNMRRANAGAAAEGAGLNISGALLNEIADQPGNMATTYEQAKQQFTNVAEQAEDWRRMGDISGDRISTDELAADAFNLSNAAEVAKKKKRLASQERARFSGSSGLGRSSLGSRGLGSQ